MDDVAPLFGTERHLVRSPAQAAFDDFVHDEVAHLIDVPSDSEAGAISALQTLIGMFEKGVDALVYDWRIHLKFRLDGETFEEKDFFNGLVRQSWTGTAPYLRKLVMTCLEQIEAGQDFMPWPSEPAFRALVLLDPDARDVWRLYLQKGDSGHFEYPATDLFDEYVQSRGWHGADDISFGVYMLFERLNWSVDAEHVLDQCGLMAAAQRLMPSHQFADVLVAEMRDSRVIENDPSGPRAAEVAEIIFEVLGQGGSYGKAALAHLMQPIEPL
jgi:hypothetical protein